MGIVFGLAIQVRGVGLTHLLAQIGTGDEHFGDDLRKTLLRRLQAVTALGGVVPDPVEIGADALDRFDVFE